MAGMAASAAAAVAARCPQSPPGQPYSAPICEGRSPETHCPACRNHRYSPSLCRFMHAVKSQHAVKFRHYRQMMARNRKTDCMAMAKAVYMSEHMTCGGVAKSSHYTARHDTALIVETCAVDRQDRYQGKKRSHTVRIPADAKGENALNPCRSYLWLLQVVGFSEPASIDRK